MSRPGVVMYFDFMAGLECLEPMQRCMVYDAIMAYGQFGTVPVFEDPTTNAVWKMIRMKLDIDMKAYEKRVAKRRSAAQSRWEQADAKEDDTSEVQVHTSSDSDSAIMQVHNSAAGENSVLETKRYDKKQNDTKQNKRRRDERKQAGQPAAAPLNSCTHFSPPDLQEVNTYCSQMGYLLDAQRFIDYYTANGWRIGKNPMQDWKAALRNWNKTEKEIAYEQRNHVPLSAPQQVQIGVCL